MKGPISAVSTPDLIERITALAGHLNAANARFLALIAELDRRQGWAVWGVKSCAHWLNWQCGINLGAAREKLRTAHALEKLPRILAAMEAGRLSYAKVRAMTRVATPANEGDLLNVALHGTAQHVEKLVRAYRRALESQELSREAQQQRNQSLWYWTEPDGSLLIKARVPAEVGALFIQALQAAEDTLAIPGVSAETPEQERPRFRHRRVEALGVLAESFLANGPQDLSGADRQQIVVHVDAQTLKHDHPGRCELEEGPSVAAETARRLACDASLIAIIENEQGEPLNVGRRTRSIPPAIRRALKSRDKGCRFPGCTFVRYVDGHHVKHWAQGGETKLSNLVTLCQFHHRLVHEGRVVVEVLDDGAFRFVKPDGESYDPPPPDLSHAGEFGEIRVAPGAAVTQWRGEKMDYGFAVQAMLCRARHCEDVSAETFSGGVSYPGP